MSFAFFRRDPYIFLVLALGLLAGWWLLRPGYFNMHDDLQMTRQLVMEECFREGQIPCRWTQHMGYGFGFPLFNYYPPLPYLIGEGIRLFSFSFVTTIKLTFLLSFLVSGVTMYLFSREFFGRLGGILSAAFYLWAPYHSVDIFVRGAMNEAWALCWFPLILWSSYKFVSSKKFSSGVLLTLSWFALLTSHNLMVMIFAPIFIIWMVFWIVRLSAWKLIPRLVWFGGWALGLSAFFTLPVFLEQKFVHVETLVQGYYEYVAHFANIRQLLTSRFWGYGASAWGDDDQMAFPVGHIHWILGIVVALLALWRTRKAKKADNTLFVTLLFFAVGWFAAFMAHSRSTFIWKQIPSLVFVQFPWRFLTLVILSFSFIAGAFPRLVFKKDSTSAKGLVMIVIAAVILWNWEFFRPQKMGPLADQQKFSGAAWDLQQTAGIYDYLPNAATTAPKAPKKQLGEIIEGKAYIRDSYQGTDWGGFTLNVESDTANIRVNIFKFPNWKVFVDGKEVVTFIDNNEQWGRMYISVPKGEHSVRAKLYNTPIRTIGNTVSAISWLGILTVPFFKRNQKS